MDYVRWTDRPKLRRPVLLAAFEGWNDAADAATSAVRYLRDRWEAIGSGRHTLILAPTGSGKTLAAFLWALDRLLVDAQPVP